MEKTLQVFHSFAEADEAERQEMWALTPLQRLEITERLRAFQYPDGQTAPRLRRLIEVVERA